MKMRRIAMSLMMISLTASSGAWAATIERTAYPAGGQSDAAQLVAVDQVLFPSGIFGTKADPMEQVDEVVQKLHDTLKQRGLGIGAMVQHTIYVKDGAVSPMDVLGRFHGTATKLAPSLKTHPSGGTILRVPSFPDPRTVVAIDAYAAAPKTKGGADEFKRIKFAPGPGEIVETVGVNEVVFTSGLEAMDFSNGNLVPTIDEQIKVIVAKLDSAMKKAGLGVGNMISHNLYVKRGTDPINVITKFHQAATTYAPELKTKPSVGTLVLVDGMAVDGFLLEIDAIAARPQQAGKPDSYKRVLFGKDGPGDIAQTVAVNDLVFLAGMEGVEAGGVSPDVLRQVEVSVNKVQAALKQNGLTIGNMVKHKLYVQKGQDVAAVRRKWHEVATKLAPELKTKPSAETIIIVEGLAGAGMFFEASVIAAKGK